MSLKLMSIAWDNKGIGQAPKLVMLALCDSADDTTKECFPSLSTLGKKADVSKTSLSYILRAFENVGAISRELRQRKNGANSSTIYTIITPLVDQKQFKKEYQKAKGYKSKTPQSEQAKDPKVNNGQAPQSEQGETPQSEQASIINPPIVINPLKNKQKNEVVFTEQVAEIIDHLNHVTGKKYKSTTDKTKSLVKARLAEGFTVNDFKEVHVIKFVDWKGTEYEKYLSPDTLYSPKFEKYLNQDVSDYQKEKIVGLHNGMSAVERLQAKGMA